MSNACDDGVPIACTATPDELPIRVEAIERLRTHLRSIERTEAGMVLQLPADAAVEAEVRRFAVEEKACCGFWTFEVQTTDDGTTLRWDGPPEVGPLFDDLIAFFRGDGPLTALAGLL